jgi:uracil-DNA glycosylase family 4
VALDPQLQGALAARIRYFRDLGVFDFYRRGGPLLAEEAPTVSQNVTIAATEPLPPKFPENLPEMPSAVSPNPPLIPTTIPLIPASPAIAPELRAAALQAIRDEIGDCQRCPLAPTRNKLVFGDGDPNARLMFVGEGPGADEDAQGLPFVGRGGQLLNNMITAMGLKREEVYIANIVKCRPPKNRVPEPIEANTCKPFLFQQIEAIQPEVIVALGSTAATYLLGAKASLSSLRGRIHHAFNTKLIVTYHPAFLLRDPTQKKEAWKDLQLAMAELGLQPKRTLS